MERLTKKSNVGEYLPVRHLNLRHEDTTSEQNLTDILDGLGKYEDTGLTPEEIREIAEKEEPKKVEEVALPYGKGFECKNCGNELSVNEFNGIYCHWCGQKLDW